MADYKRFNVPHPIQVSRWKQNDDLREMINSLESKGISCALYTRFIDRMDKVALFRQRLPGDPIEIEDQKPFDRKMIGSCPVNP